MNLPNEQSLNMTKAARGDRRAPKSRTPNWLMPNENRWLTATIYLCLIGLTWIVFGRALHFDFLNYDDSFYVYQNPSISNGLTWAGLIAAFTRPLVGNWHPLTSISLMLDAQIFGLHPGGYHFVNLLLHTIAVLLLFHVLRAMTGSLWRSALVAALFAIHPLRAESVVWISERKDVLSGVFFFLTLAAYLRYARRPRFSTYLLVAGFLTLGLLAKAMLVTVPCVLLLLDYWPLRRFAFLPPTNSASKNLSSLGATRLIVEKLPLLGITTAVSAATVWAQEPALAAAAQWSISARVENALLTIWIYLRQMFWPADLAIFYPHPGNHLPFWEVGTATMSLVIVCGAVIAGRQRYPYLLTGWFWYLGMLVPVIGLVQVGWQAHADRYTYLPQIGLYLIVAWGAGEFVRRGQIRRSFVGIALALVLVSLAVIAWRQVGYWNSSVRLWRHTLAVTQNNDVAERGLGTALLLAGDVEGAIRHDRLALKIRPGDPNGLTNLANALFQHQELPEAIERYREVLRLHPNDNEIHRSLGKALWQSGARAAAMMEFRAALRLRPNDADAAFCLGNAFLQERKLPQAIDYFRRAIATQNNHLGAHFNLAIALRKNGQLDDAIAESRQAVRLQPQNADAHNNLALALLQKGRVHEAIAEWQMAVHLRPKNAAMRNNLALALQRAGRIE